MLGLSRRDVIVGAATAAALGARSAHAANMHQLLKALVEQHASELVMTTGAPGMLRIEGELVPLKMPPLTPVEVKQLAYAVLTDAQKAAFEKDSALRMSFGVKELSRFRMQLYLQRGAVAATLKPIPFKVPPMDAAFAATAAKWVAAKPGLFVISGAVDSGRTSALATLIDKLDVETHGHLMTIEDPIEFLYPHKNAIVEQVEVSADCPAISACVSRAVAVQADVYAWDSPHNPWPEVLQLAQTGRKVIAVANAPSPELVHEQAALKKLIAGHVHLTLPPAAKGKPRKLAVHVVV